MRNRHQQMYHIALPQRSESISIQRATSFLFKRLDHIRTTASDLLLVPLKFGSYESFDRSGRYETCVLTYTNLIKMSPSCNMNLDNLEKIYVFACLHLNFITGVSRCAHTVTAALARQGSSALTVNRSAHCESIAKHCQPEVFKY
jgi:hypothetical protein